MTYLLCLFVLLVSSQLFTGFHLCYFAPLLCLGAMSGTLNRALWIAFGAGLTLDLLSSELPFGSHILCHTGSIFAIYHLRIYFDIEKPHAVALYSALIAFALTVGERFLLSFFQVPIKIDLLGVITEFGLMPLVNGLYGLMAVWLPTFVWSTGLKLWRARRAND
ncbi:MAG: hypothetical protein MRY21_03755 [Simkaniaceae bacterium]|nr:hypothetical protein [Simkaniaceae bacterium]